MVTREDMSKKFSKLGKYGLHCKQATMSEGEKYHG